jgi:hypothetical protein
MEDDHTARRSRIVKGPIRSVYALHPKFRNASGHSRHRPGVRHSNPLTHLQAKQTLPQAKADFLRKAANGFPRFWVEDDRPHIE